MHEGDDFGVWTDRPRRERCPERCCTRSSSLAHSAEHLKILGNSSDDGAGQDGHDDAAPLTRPDDMADISIACMHEGSHAAPPHTLFLS